MTTPLKICSGCDRERRIWKSEGRNKYCEFCWQKKQHEVEPEVQSPRKRSPTRRIREKSIEPTAKLEAKLDQLLRKYMLATCEPECYTCGFNTGIIDDLQVGHYMSRRHMHLRWDLRNVRMQCAHCNVTLHSNEEVYTAKLEQEQPGLSETLRRESTLVTKVTISDLRLFIQQFETLINEAAYKHFKNTT
jgi:5-methylcytosine-specific restriction endonuclease McrA